MKASKLLKISLVTGMMLAAVLVSAPQASAYWGGNWSGCGTGCGNNWGWNNWGGCGGGCGINTCNSFIRVIRPFFRTCGLGLGFGGCGGCGI